MQVSINNIFANCEYGTVGKILDFGVSNGEIFDEVSSGTWTYGECAVNDLNRSCTPNSKNFTDAVNSLIGGTNPSAVVDSSSLYELGTGDGCN